MNVISIDPGLSGALAYLENGVLEAVHRMPVRDSEIDLASVIDLLLDYERDVVVIEEQQSMPKQGVASTFKTGMNFGILIGAIETLEYPLVRIRAVEWKRANGLLGKDKAASRRLASELWPRHRDHFKLVKDDGMAEAALIGRGYIIRYVREERAFV